MRFDSVSSLQSADIKFSGYFLFGSVENGKRKVKTKKERKNKKRNHEIT